jgi:hypothetical protein
MLKLLDHKCLSPSPHMIAGFKGKHPGNATKVAYRFDTVTEKFETLPDLPVPRASAAVAYDPMNKRLHYIGGLVDRNQNSDMHWSLDVTAPIASMNWTEEAPFPQARNHLQGIFMNGTIYLAGSQLQHRFTFPPRNRVKTLWLIFLFLPRRRSVWT